ncbi:MAG: hypothetical protein ABI726_05270 [bacterium]
MVLASAAFIREHLRAPLTLALLVLIPALFVIASAAVLGEFASALGGAVAGASATALGAGWAAAFLAGALGFFQVSSSREADRRLALAGLGPAAVAWARIGASVALALVVSAAAFVTLELREPPLHPAHAAAGVVAFAVIYVGIGTLIGSFVSGQLEGSLTVALIFLVDIFSGPGMTDSGGVAAVLPTRQTAELLIAAGAGRGSPTEDWLVVVLTAAASLTAAFCAFWWSARPRSG